jgi:hypothetical protein
MGVEVPVEVHVGVVHVGIETRVQTIYPIQPEYKFQEKMIMKQCYYPVEALAEVPVEARVEVRVEVPVDVETRVQTIYPIQTE